MSETINKYTDIIRVQSQLLTDSKLTHMSLAQRQAIELINRYAVQIVNMTNAYESGTSNMDCDRLRHELINTLTPIVGYSEMLVDEWIGTLATNQQKHVEIIHQNVQSLRTYIQSYQFHTDMSMSA